ncbi:MAG: WD40/YVTN/BNR-like repeat-containing protein [Chloroflexota bacterium]
MQQPRAAYLVSSRDGLFLVGRGGGPGAAGVRGPLLAGHDVAHARRDPVSGTLWAAARRGDAPVIAWSDDDGATWARPNGPLPCEKVWQIHAAAGGVVWAGIEPAGLLRSGDGGATWDEVPGLDAHPTRDEWYSGGGGMMLHTILTTPERPARIVAGISVAGCFRSEDGGLTWHPSNTGTSGDGEMWEQFTGNVSRFPEVHRCVHKIVGDPTRPDRFFMQGHDGTYRSDDGGASWTDISAGLPSRFGFGIAAAPHDGPAGCAVWVVPQSGETLRTEDGITAWRTLDAGATWQSQRTGLPDAGDWMVLRDAMAADAAGVCFGSSDGTLWESADAGETWRALATGLGRIQAVEIG